jgi:Holliday junction DNA helicase RuvA
MIATVAGVLADREGETIVVQTDGGVGYAITVPLGVFERLPPRGARVSLHTELVVREDGWALYGFDRAGDRIVFQRLLGATGFGPKLAMAVLSALGPDRTVRSIRDRDIAALSTVTGIGRKKAERLVLELRDRFDDIVAAPAERPATGSDRAVRALVALGYSSPVAEEAVRGALSNGGEGDTAAVVRRALAALTATKK